MREDYSTGGDAWAYLAHARSRAHRRGEDVRGLYFGRDGTPTHPCMSRLHRSPQREHPCEELLLPASSPRP